MCKFRKQHPFSSKNSCYVRTEPQSPAQNNLPGHFKQHTIAFNELVLGSARRTTIPCSEQFTTASHNEVRPMMKLQTQTEKLENPRGPAGALGPETGLPRWRWTLDVGPKLPSKPVRRLNRPHSELGSREQTEEQHNLWVSTQRKGASWTAHRT